MINLSILKRFIRKILIISTELLGKTKVGRIVFEQLVTTAKTIQQRILAGYFTFLTQAAARSADGQRSRKLTLTDEALTGKSRKKKEQEW